MKYRMNAVPGYKWSFFSLSLALVLLMTGCQKQVEVIEEKGEAGNVIVSYERRTKDFAKHGDFRGFHEDGEIFEESTYVDNKLEGKRTLYYKSGTVQSEETYVAGKLEGPKKDFDAGGNLVREGNFVEHAMRGEWKFYYPSGKIKEIVEFADNEENGPFQEFYESGKLKTEGTYEGSFETGELKEYDETGKLVKRMECEITKVADEVFSRCNTVWTIDSTATEIK